MNEHQPQPSPEELPPGPEQQRPTEATEALPRDGPRIYVASLTDYNNGILHGRWIDATDDEDDMHGEISEMLAASPTAKRYGDIAEEWAIHDFEGFGELRLGEYDSLSTIAKIAAGIEEHGLAYTAWAQHVNSDNELLDQFEERYRGEWNSIEHYAEEFLDDLGADQAIDQAAEWLRPYLTIDIAGFARDLELSGDIITGDTPDGGVFVFGGW